MHEALTSLLRPTIIKKDDPVLTYTYFINREEKLVDSDKMIIFAGQLFKYIKI